jgi:hypothetical protein
MPMIGLTATTVPALFWLVWLVSLTSCLAIILGNFVIEVRRGALPWHDRLAGTEVVLGR